MPSNLGKMRRAPRVPEPAADEVARAAAGDRDAFRALVERYQNMVFAVAFSVLGDRTEAEDAAQESFLRLYCRLDRFRGEAAFGTWLFRLAVNASVDQARRRRRGPAPDPASALPQLVAGAEVTAERHERLVAVLRALAELPLAGRGPLVLREVYGYEYAEIAALLGKPVGTVKAAVHRGRVALRAALERRGVTGMED